MKNSLTIFALMILAAVTIAFTQSRTISGRVSDDQGQPLAGVIVSANGSGTGTKTDLKGNYRITIGESDKVLLFSLRGFETVEVKINTKSIIDVVLKPGRITGDGLKKRNGLHIISGSSSYGA